MMNDVGMARLVDEVTTIKKLLIYALLENGASQSGIAGALGVNQSSVSRMFGDGGVTKRPSGSRRKVSVEVTNE